jgi:lysophospholipase L1-like esterase
LCVIEVKTAWGNTMRSKRSALSIVLSAVAAASLVATALIVVPGVSQAATKHVKKVPLYYVSLGDSYAIGYQPGLPGTGGSRGYTAYVAMKERMTLKNFGCGGATTSSIIDAISCSQPAATHAVPYPTTTQAAAALAFIAANPGEVGLVTVSIGGNDVTSCANDSSEAAILTCVEAADTSITTNVTSLVGSLDSALTSAGDSAPVVGLTYPDVILGDWVYPAAAPNQSLAALSVTAFDSLINPALQAAYGSANFVNVTQAPYKHATSGDDSDTPVPPATTVPLIKLKPYGKIPPAVWEVCTLTYFCSQGNIHANTKGYEFIGKLIVAHLKDAA